MVRITNEVIERQNAKIGYTIHDLLVKQHKFSFVTGVVPPQHSFSQLNVIII